ncbi:MAG: hypothetical protein ACR2HN_10400, partial [Tepidiformaceae bacterium]
MKPTSEATTPHPPITPVATHAPAARTGDSALDRIIDAVLSRDVAGVQGLLAFEDYACGITGDRTSSYQPLICQPGVAAGTLTTGLFVSGVEGRMVNPEGAMGIVGLYLNSEPSASLYAVVR